MANFNKKVLGTAAGAIGDIVFKTRYGKTYVCSRPVDFKKSMTEDSVGNRNKFQFQMKLYPALGKIFWFKYLWTNAEISGDTYINKMFKVNSERIDENLDFRNILMIPVDGGFEAGINSFTFEEKKLTVKIGSLGKDSGIDKNKQISFQGVIYLTEPKSKKDFPFAFIPFNSDVIPAIQGEELVFEIKLEGEIFFPIRKFSKVNFMANLLTRDSEGQPKNVSINICSW